ncbi:MAG: lyase family protein [bacterium]
MISPMKIDLFDAVSPLDYRYYGADERVFKALKPYLSEGAYVKYLLRVEWALVKALAGRRICSQSAADEVKRACEEVTPEEVHEEEKKTRHNIRALVNCLRRRVSDSTKPYIHFTATSADILDTATSLRYRDAAEGALIPKLVELEMTLIGIAEREKATIQIGRTHGQHAVPITFGFALAEYISRLGGRIESIRDSARNLRGKMAGAVGAYNASGLLFPDPERFEEEVLAELGLKPSPHSTQIVEPEFIADFLHACTSCFGVLANLADDMRHLQRTEIGEVAERFEATQVGSSTMPHKRNPWNFENVKSMYKSFVPRILTVYLDQISEHQRDLTNSASGRFATEILVGLYASADRLNRVCSKLVVDEESMRRNFELSRDTIIAEPLYILLSAQGHPDAHECVRKLTLESQETGKTLKELVAEKPELKPYLERMNSEQRAILRNPELYIGRAVEKTEAICEFWKRRLSETFP